MSEIGRAFVSVVPSTRGFQGSLAKQIDPELDKAGKRSGKRFGLSFGTAFKAGGITAGVPSAPLLRARPEELG